MADLPLEVIIDILCRLPVKTLLRCRCTSKSWRLIIDSTEFNDLHLRKSTETNSNICIILRQDSDLYAVDFDKIDKAVELNHPLMCYSNRIKVLGFCKGLLCISNIADDIALWNPSTRRHRILPFLHTERRRESGKSLFGARVYGFGYDTLGVDYKLVKISQFINLDSRGYDSEIKVYSLRTNAWRSVESMPFALCYARKMGVLASNALHWVVTRKLEPSEPDLVVAFDLRFENFREVPLPEIASTNFSMDVDVLGGSLCMVANYHDVQVDVWVMEEYGCGRSWSKLFTVAQPDVIRSFKYLRPLCYSKDGDKVLLEQDHKKLCWYDLKSKRASSIKISGIPVSFEAGISLGSLVPVTLERKMDREQQKLEEENKKKKRDDFLSKGFKLVL
ncbi:F-box protein [Quillaja saponaria]|uniref:F-box protein n=1 Tax=Quillaja saponaria TaxID=32244 RepID=A0AAD7M333_QUISA|nr:F-box protein [Quillaja saponaria]KAJ7967796.1 F-box protein [Quillaja saponaria]